jgi:hypothetical protein
LLEFFVLGGQNGRTGAADRKGEQKGKLEWRTGGADRRAGQEELTGGEEWRADRRGERNGRTRGADRKGGHRGRTGGADRRGGQNDVYLVEPISAKKIARRNLSENLFRSGSGTGSGRFQK